MPIFFCDRLLETTASKGWLLTKCIFEFWQWVPTAFENKADLGNLYLCRQCSCTKYEGCIRPCDSCQQLLHWKKHKREGKKIPSKNDDTKESLALCLVLFFESHFVETQPKLMKSLFCFLFKISSMFYVFPTQFSDSKQNQDTWAGNHPSQGSLMVYQHYKYKVNKWTD